jgi:hypothetical protein
MSVARLLLTIPFSVIILLLNIYPYHPVTFVGWSILLLLSVPVLIISEYFGDKVLKAAFVQSFSRPARIVYGVVILGVTLGVFILAEPLLAGHLAKWSF